MFHPARVFFWIALLFLIGVAAFYLITKTPPPPPRPISSQGVFRPIYAARERFLKSLEHSVGQPDAAFFGGILVGARSTLPSRIIKDFRRTGISHITAVSGYNITIIAETLMTALLWLFLPRRTAFWIVLLILLVFMVLTGLQASVVRATIMGCFVLAARHIGRVPTPLHSLTIAAAIMVAIHPHILLYDAGFQLSVLATLGILIIMPLLENKFPRIARIPLIGETALMTISAQLAVLPLLIYYFKSISIVSLPVNIIVLPAIPWAMLAGFVVGVAGMIMPWLGTVAGAVATVLSRVLLWFVHWAGGFSWAAHTVAIGWLGMLIWYAGIALALFLWYPERNDYV